MELFLITLIFAMSPLELFLKIGNIGTFSQFVGILLSVVFFYKALRGNKVTIPKEGYFILLFVIVGFLSSFWAVYPVIALSRSFTLVQLFVLYIIVFNFLASDYNNLVKKFFTFLILWGSGISIYLIRQAFKMQSITAWSRISIAQNVDVNHLASFLIVPLFLSFYYIEKKSIKYLNPTLLIFSGVLLTQSRGAILAIVIGLLLYFFSDFKSGLINFKLIASIVFGVFLIYWLVPKDFLYRITIMITDKTVFWRGSGRDVIWELAWQFFKQKPFWGIGLGNFAVLVRPAHSSFFQIVSELGILGIVTTGLFLYSFLKPLRNNRNCGLKIEFILVVSLLIMSLTVDIFYRKYLWIMLAIYSSKKRFLIQNQDNIDSIEI